MGEASREQKNSSGACSDLIGGAIVPVSLRLIRVREPFHVSAERLSQEGDDLNSTS